MSKVKRYCSIQKWIEENDHKLYDFLDDNCLLGIFKFRQGTSGVTFLCPKNWKDIEKGIESGDYIEAVNTLKAHVLHGFYPNLDGLMEQQDGIVNALGQLVQVKSKSGNAVVLENGAKITEAKFQGTPDRQNIMVFHYDGKPLPTNAPAGTLKYTSAPSGKRSKHGGFAFEGLNKVGRTKLIEQQALILIKQSKFESHNPYAGAVVSLYAYAKDKPEEKQLLDMLDVYPEQAYYAIVQPYGKSPLESLIDSWLKDTGGLYVGANPCGEYYVLLSKAGYNTGKEAEPVVGKLDRSQSILNKMYNGKLECLASDAIRWFIHLRRSEHDDLFANPRKFITLVYDLVMLGANPTDWIVNPTSDGSLFMQSRYAGYSCSHRLPGDIMTVSEASALSPAQVTGGGRVIAGDEAAQYEKLRVLGEENKGGDSWSGKFEAAKQLLQASGLSA